MTDNTDFSVIEIAGIPHFLTNDGRAFPQIAGGSGETEETEEGGETEEETTEEGGEEETEVSRQVDPEEFERTKQALAKANKEAKKHRLEAKKLREQSESDSERAKREAAEEAEHRAVERYKKPLIKAEARALLLESGLSSNPERFLKMIDIEEVDIDDDTGEITGVAEQIKEIKKEFPEVFNAKKSAPKIDSGDKKPHERKPKSSAEKIAAFIAGDDS